jgi:nucleoside-diphosphate-sugar epimerase
MSQTYLVTGGAGFIGSNIARALLKRGDKVRVIDNFLTGKRANLEEILADIDLIEGDIRDVDTLGRALRGVEVVFHEAAIPSVPRSMVDPISSHDVNSTGTLAVLRQAKQAGVRRVVYAASSSAYGDTPTLPKIETMSPAPLSPYAVAKLTGEYYCKVFASAYGLETVSLRYFNVFGARQDPASEYAAVIPRFITAALAGNGVTIYGDGHQSRDFCYIDNVVEANLAAASAPAASGRVFNVACGSATSLNQLVEALAGLVGHRVPTTYAPARVGDVKHSLADIEAARSILGYSAAIDFGEGLKRTFDWYASRAASK